MKFPVVAEKQQANFRELFFAAPGYPGIDKKFNYRWQTARALFCAIRNGARASDPKTRPSPFMLLRRIWPSYI